MANQTYIAPPYDPEIAEALKTAPELPIPSDPSIENVAATRDMIKPFMSTASTLAMPELSFVDHIIPGPRGDITISVITRNDTIGKGRPAIYNIHGGGMILGGRYDLIQLPLEWVKTLNAVLITIEYRLAPEHPDPAPVEDCYAGLLWVRDNLDRLGIDPDRLMIHGISAGGGLAAGTALMARDKGGPKLCGQLLACPMLDDRNETISSKTFISGSAWVRPANILGWTCLLGDRINTEDVSIYASPARAENLSNLPQAFIDVSSTEVFRDEDVAYASRLWASGVQAELHVWPAGPHGYETLAPNAALTKQTYEARTKWVSRVLSRADATP